MRFRPLTARRVRLFSRRLEDRLAPAAFVVTTLADDLVAPAGSLREALSLSATTLEADTISFGALTGTINLKGQLNIGGDVTVAGPGATLLTLNGGGIGRVVSINGVGSLNVTLSGLTVTGGKVTGDGGGILCGTADFVTLSDIVVTNNEASDSGGGIGMADNGGRLFLIRATISNNKAGQSGGGVYVRSGSQGAAVEFSAITGNTAAGKDGGGLYAAGGLPFGIAIRHSTISGNLAKVSGGGVGLRGGSSLVPVVNSTVTNNTAQGGAGEGGGGLAIPLGAYPAFAVTGSIVAGNFAPAGTGPDILTANIVNADRSAFGTTAGITTFNDPGGQSLIGAALNLQPLASNGGPTQTHALGVGSAAIDAGVNPASFATPFDQRGSGFTRAYGTVDMGAFEFVPAGSPSAAGVSPAVTAPAAVYAFAVNYYDDVGIDTTTLNGTEVSLTGPAAFGAVTLTKVEVFDGGKRVVASYEAAPPGGTFDAADNGVYSLDVVAGKVTDGTTPIPGGSLVPITVAVPLSLVVNSTFDETADTDGKLSLREAVLAANGVAGTTEVITFDPGVFLPGTVYTLTNGEMTVTDSLSIVGPGVGNLSINGNNASRAFALTKAFGTFSLSDAEVTNCKSTGNGGALSVAADSLEVTLTRVTFKANASTATSSSGGGGAIATNAGGQRIRLTITDSLFTANTATGGTATDGGAIRSGLAITLVIGRSTFSNNLSNDDGGAVLVGNSSVEITDSTFSGNRGGLGANNDGGGLQMANVIDDKFLIIRNSTFSANKAGGSGGGVNIASTGNTGLIIVANNTFTLNELAGTAGFGGGLHRASGTMQLESNILSGNTNSAPAANGPDLFAAAVTTFQNNAIGTATGFPGSGSGNQVGTAVALNPLALAGGPTAVHVPGPGSPVRNAGSNPFGLGFDQRGAGFARTLQSFTDIGAVESLDPIPSAKFNATGPVIAPGPTPDSFTVTYVDDVAINAASIDAGDVEVTAPGGAKLAITKATVDNPSNGSPRTATYTFALPGGTWDAGDNGTYTVTLLAGQVFDTAGTPNAVPAGTLGTFQVLIPQTLVVSENSDVEDGDFGPGKLSLREAIGIANAISPSADTITFDPAVFTAPSTIVLGGTELKITDALMISGPGAAALAIDANFFSRVFNIDTPVSGVAMAISGLTLTNGAATGSGGAILLNDEALTLTGVTLSGNNATGNGGAVSVTNKAASLTAVGCVFDANTAAGDGGGLFVTSTSVITVRDTTFSGNAAGGAFGDGGGICMSNGGTLLVERCTLSGNSAGGTNVNDAGGGGIFGRSSYLFVTVRNSTISGNTSAGGGGGIMFANTLATLTIQNSTVVLNQAEAGGGVRVTGTLTTTTVSSTIVALNTANTAGTEDLDATATTTDSLVGIDPLIEPLAANGGLTQTHALKAGSPAIDAGSNTLALATDQRSSGFARVAGAKADIGAFEVQSAVAPPTVTKVQVNDGSVQRSRVTSLTVTFSEAVTFPSGVIAAFVLNRTGPGSPTGAVNLSAVQAGSSVTLTFLDGGAVPTEGKGSLIDGVYQLTIVAANVQGAGGSLDGDGNGTGGDNFQTPAAGAGRITRLFGDADGDGDVDAVDYGAFRAAFGNPGFTFDSDGDGDVDAVDYGQFRQRFGVSV